MLSFKSRCPPQRDSCVAVDRQCRERFPLLLWSETEPKNEALTKPTSSQRQHGENYRFECAKAGGSGQKAGKPWREAAFRDTEKVRANRRRRQKTQLNLRTF